MGVGLSSFSISLFPLFSPRNFLPELPSLPLVFSPAALAGRSPVKGKQPTFQRFTLQMKEFHVMRNFVKSKNPETRNAQLWQTLGVQVQVYCLDLLTLIYLC